MGMIRFKAATRCWVGCSCNERTAKRADTRASLVGGGLSKPTLPGGSLLVHARPTLTPTSTYAALSGIAVHPACLCRPAIDGRPLPRRCRREPSPIFLFAAPHRHSRHARPLTTLPDNQGFSIRQRRPSMEERAAPGVVRVRMEPIMKAEGNFPRPGAIWYRPGNRGVGGVSWLIGWPRKKLITH